MAKKVRMTSKTGTRGFTLIEVMVTVSILALGTILIQQGLLRSAALLNHYSNILVAERWEHEKFWELREGFFYTQSIGAADANSQGSFAELNRDFRWRATVEPVGKTYRMNLEMEWLEGNKLVLRNTGFFASSVSKEDL